MVVLLNLLVLLLALVLVLAIAAATTSGSAPDVSENLLSRANADSIILVGSANRVQSAFEPARRVPAFVADGLH